MLIAGAVLATFFQSGLVLAYNSHQEIKNGSIRIGYDESAYPGLAKITMDQARDTALAKIQGDVLKMELEDENGFLIYSVEVVSPEKTIADVKIDAGNGEILAVEKDDSDHDRDDHYFEHDGDEHDNND